MLAQSVTCIQAISDRRTVASTYPLSCSGSTYPLSLESLAWLSLPLMTRESSRSRRRVLQTIGNPVTAPIPIPTILGCTCGNFDHQRFHR